VRQIGGSNVEIESDPLGSRYQVNKFGLIVTAEDNEIIFDTYNRLLVLLKVECWTFEQSPSGHTVHVTYPPLAPAHATIDKPHIDIFSRMRIGIH
jgi:hypothetical protein